MEDETKEGSPDYNKYLIVGVVCLLLVFSVVQAFQISSIKEKLSAGGASITAAPVFSAPSSPPRTAAPSMVGGC